MCAIGAAQNKIAQEWKRPYNPPNNVCGGALVECAERARLAEVLRVANHELAWVQTEEARIAAEEPHRLTEFERIVEVAEAHRKLALTNYTRHLAEHGCGRLEILDLS